MLTVKDESPEIMRYMKNRWRCKHNDRGTCKVTGKTGVTGTAVAATATKTVSNSVAVSAVKSSVTAGATLETAITPSQAASDVTYQWAYKATSAGSFANISGATSATYVATNPGYYQVTIALKTGSTYGLSGTTTATYTVAKSALPAVTSKNVTGAGALTPRTTNLENDVIQIAVGTIASTNYNIQWYALDAATDAPSSSNAISGATGTSYTLASTGVGKYIVAVVTGANDTDYQGAEVASSQYFVSGTLNAPTISGNKTVGSTLTATVTGNSTVTSKDYTLQWYRVTNDATATETAITGATGATYKLTDADMIKSIAYGDEYFHYYQDASGNIIQRDPSSKYWKTVNMSNGVLSFGSRVSAKTGKSTAAGRLKAAAFSNKANRTAYSRLADSSYSSTLPQTSNELLTYKSLKKTNSSYFYTKTTDTRTSVPLLTIVIGFNNMAYENDYDWGNYIFSGDQSIGKYYEANSNGKFTFAPCEETSQYEKDGNTNTRDAVNDGIVHAFRGYAGLIR